MSEIRSAFEKAMEKIGGIKELSDKEKRELKDLEELKSVLAVFYRGELTRDQLWSKMKGSSPPVLRDAQHMVVDSLRLASTSEEVRKRREGILAIEALKDVPNTVTVENLLNAISRLQKESDQAKEQAINELRAAIESNPQMRMQKVRLPDGRTVMQPALSVDEAVQKRAAEFMEVHQQRYGAMFAQAVGQLKTELK